MPEIEVREDWCKECGLCIKFCPKNLITKKKFINESGYHPVKLAEKSKCTGCTFCAIVCPETAIEVYK